MASIKGFQLKSVRNIFGREGYGCSATMYLNGKKIGTYVDYGDGAEEEVDYISDNAKEKMMELIISYAKEHPSKCIVDLYKERPKQFKEECERFKKNNPYVLDEDITIETMSANSIVYIVSDFLELFDKEKIFKKYIKKGYTGIAFKDENGVAFKGTSEKYINDGYEVYTSMEDFIVE